MASRAIPMISFHMLSCIHVCLCSCIAYTCIFIYQLMAWYINEWELLTNTKNGNTSTCVHVTKCTCTLCCWDLSAMTSTPVHCTYTMYNYITLFATYAIIILQVEHIHMDAPSDTKHCINSYTYNVHVCTCNNNYDILGRVVYMTYLK